MAGVIILFSMGFGTLGGVTSGVLSRVMYHFIPYSHLTTQNVFFAGATMSICGIIGTFTAGKRRDECQLITQVLISSGIFFFGVGLFTGRILGNVGWNLINLSIKHNLLQIFQ